MLVTNRPDAAVTNAHRVALRRIPLEALADAYCALITGSGEPWVCAALGIDGDTFSGVLEQALRELLWERGYFSDSKPAGRPNVVGDSARNQMNGGPLIGAGNGAVEFSLAIPTGRRG